MTATLPATLRVIERGWLSSNSILAFDGDAATLIDSGYVGHAERTVELVRQALAGRTLARLVNTHTHSDHVGGNAALQRAFGCDVVVPAGAAAPIAAWDQEALLLSLARQRSERFRYDGVIRAGDEFAMGGLVWRALAVPGHDMNALAFHCEQERLLISGDALWQDGFGIVFGEVLGKPGALAATRATLDAIGRLGVERVIPGHGAPFADVDAALGRAYKRLAAFEQDPARMAKNAIKACFIFNLLDLQRLPHAEFESYVAGVPLFADVGARLLGMAPDALARWLYDELLRAGAIVDDGEVVMPTMAA